jgi:hypothetical protein
MSPTSCSGAKLSRPGRRFLRVGRQASLSRMGLRLLLGAEGVEINRAKAGGSCRFLTVRTKHTEAATHAGFSWRTFSDAGSILAVSTNLKIQHKARTSTIRQKCRVLSGCNTPVRRFALARLRRIPDRCTRVRNLSSATIAQYAYPALATTAGLITFLADGNVGYSHVFGRLPPFLALRRGPRLEHAAVLSREDGAYPPVRSKLV